MLAPRLLEDLEEIVRLQVLCEPGEDWLAETGRRIPARRRLERRALAAALAVRIAVRSAWEDEQQKDAP